MIEHRPTDARADNRLLSQRERSAGETRLLSRPRILFVELTRYCNLHCVMCREPGSVPPSERMSEALFSRIEEELFPTADIVDLRGWGESLILPEISDRARRVARSGASMRVVTNLSFERDSVLDLLAELGCYIGVSVDSADPGMLSQLRRGAKLSLIERNLDRLSAEYRRRGQEDRLCIYVTCQRPALEGLESLVELCARHEIRDMRLAPVTVEDRSPLCLTQVQPALRQALARVESAGRRHGVRVSFTASPIEGMLPNTDAEPCLHPWAYCYFTYDGRVGFCDHLIGPHGDPYVMGSLSASSFEEIWNGPAWVALRAEHLGQRRASAPRFEECAWCYRNRHLDFEELLEPAQAERRSLLRPGMFGEAELVKD